MIKLQCLCQSWHLWSFNLKTLNPAFRFVVTSNQTPKKKIKEHNSRDVIACELYLQLQYYFAYKCFCAFNSSPHQTIYKYSKSFQRPKEYQLMLFVQFCLLRSITVFGARKHNRHIISDCAHTHRFIMADAIADVR